MVEKIKCLVRPFMGFAFTITAVYMTAKGMIKPETFWGTLSVIVGFYFGERAARKQG